MRTLPSGRWQARDAGPDGAMRTLGTCPTKDEADKALAPEVSEMARENPSSHRASATLDQEC